MDSAQRTAVGQWMAATSDMIGGRMFAPDASAKATIDMIEDDLKFLNGAAAFFAKDAELDKMLYALHKVDPKYRKRLFKDSFRLMTEVNECLQAVLLSKSVIKRSTWHVFGAHIDGCRIIYGKLVPAFREIKRRLAKGDAQCLDDPMLGLSEEDCVVYTNRMVEDELAKENAA